MAKTTKKITAPNSYSLPPENIKSQKGKHHGHQYKQDCICARCKRTTDKLEKEAQIQALEDQLAEARKTDVSKNLKDGEGIILITDDTFVSMRKKVAELKALFTFTDESQFMNSLANESIQFFCESLSQEKPTTDTNQFDDLMKLLNDSEKQLFKNSFTQLMIDLKTASDAMIKKIEPITLPKFRELISAMQADILDINNFFESKFK